jgi:ABC-type Fe3+-hydroxamate transport system substrate-binding protein
VTIGAIPPSFPIVGIVSTAHRPHNGSLLVGGFRRGALFAALLLSPGCSHQEGAPPPQEDPGGSWAQPGEASSPFPPHVQHPETSPREPGPGQAAFPAALTDAVGRTWVFQASPTRVVSLVPSATRTLEALGARHLLAGRTAFDTTESLASLPSVGGGLHPNLEILLALKPDLVIRHAGGSDRATPLRLDEAGVPHLAVHTDGLDDVRALIGDLGRLTGRGPEADSLLADMDARFQEIRSRIAGLPPVRVAYVLGGNPPWVAGPGTFIHELITASGGENAFADLKAHYGPVSSEELLVREIHLVLAPEGSEVFLPSSALPMTRVPSDMEIPGPHLAHLAWKLAALLHPQAFR